MMKSTDFATLLSKYFIRYLPNERGSSPQTIDSYRNAFILPVKTVNELVKLLSDNKDKTARVFMTRKNIVFVNDIFTHHSSTFSYAYFVAYFYFGVLVPSRGMDSDHLGIDAKRDAKLR